MIQCKVISCYPFKGKTGKTYTSLVVLLPSGELVRVIDWMGVEHAPDAIIRLTIRPARDLTARVQVDHSPL